MKGIAAGIVFALSSSVAMGQTPPHIPLKVVSDWTHHHVLYPDSGDPFLMERLRRDPRWESNWYLRHREVWWPEHHHRPHKGNNGSARDWSLSLGGASLTSGFEPLFNFAFTIGPDAGYGVLDTTDPGNGQFLATAGTLTVTAGKDIGTYPVYPGGPAEKTSPSGFFLYDNLLYPSVDPAIDNGGPLFLGSGREINIFSNGPSNYQFYDNSGYNNTGATFTLNVAPGGGQTYPAKFVFDVGAAPSCANDFVVIGIPANAAAGGQANIVGVNNLYSSPTLPALCGTTGPTVKFAYASGSGQVPASAVISPNGTQIAYIENRITGSSYFHVLTIGTTGTNGSSAAAAVAPGAAGGNNAVDQTVLLSPDGGVTNQGSTNTIFVDYANDVAYATTFSTAGSGSGYLYKIRTVFNSVSPPTLVWSVPINAIPSTPVYDQVSRKIFFTDSDGRIDYVLENGTPPAGVVYGTVVASGTTSEYPVIVDSTHQMVYASFNSNGSNAVVVQAPTSMVSSVTAAVGTKSTIYTSPYSVDFNNAWYTGTGTPLLYVAGTGSGTIPTLYSVGFNASGVMNSSANPTTAALASGTADSSPVTEFYNPVLNKDYLFVGVTNNCIATTGGGTGGCVMSLDITGGFPTVNASSTALPATGGTTGIIVDNDSSLSQASSIYYATKTGGTLVKATQTGLN